MSIKFGVVALVLAIIAALLVLGAIFTDWVNQKLFVDRLATALGTSSFDELEFRFFPALPGGVYSKPRIRMSGKKGTAYFYSSGEGLSNGRPSSVDIRELAKNRSLVSVHFRSVNLDLDQSLDQLVSVGDLTYEQCEFKTLDWKRFIPAGVKRLTIFDSNIPATFLKSQSKQLDSVTDISLYRSSYGTSREIDFSFLDDLFSLKTITVKGYEDESRALIQRVVRKRFTLKRVSIVNSGISGSDIVRLLLNSAEMDSLEIDAAGLETGQLTVLQGESIVRNLRFIRFRLPLLELSPLKTCQNLRSLSVALDPENPQNHSSDELAPIKQHFLPDIQLTFR